MHQWIGSVESWYVFAKVVQTASITRASIELGMDASRVSKVLLQLEKGVEAQLIDRSVRPIRPTERGAAVYETILPLLRDWTAFQNGLTDPSQGKVTIRLSTPVGIGRMYLNNQISDYCRDNPRIAIEASVDAIDQDVLDGKVDVAFIEKSALKHLT